MKLVSFFHDGTVQPGVVTSDGNRIVALGGLTADMNSLIADFGALRSRIEALRDSGKGVALDKAKLSAPITPRRNVFCVGKNYHEHAHEFTRSGFDSGATTAAEAIPTAPIIFSKPPSSVIGSQESILHALDPSDSVDYEAEVAIVIGRGGRVAPGDDPWSYVFGITLINDVTSRELQKVHKQWFLGKGIDTFAPMGPTLVTLDDIKDFGALRLKCYVNDELRQSALLSDLIFDVPTLVSTIGRSITLQPGDVIATGTPAGVGIGFTPPRYLRPGDVVRVELDPVGVLVNPVA
jgi:2-keto-4-pentenoate hydratase/2-oxohepta-3-ene-1,7-dioic acid hydratase in catechol pathway